MNDIDNDYRYQEPETDVTAQAVCNVCGKSLEGKRRDSVYCSRACRQRFKRAEKRVRERKSSYLESHPELSAEDLENALAEAQEILEGDLEDLDPVFSEILSMASPGALNELTDEFAYQEWETIEGRYSGNVRGYSPQSRYNDTGTSDKFRQRAQESRRINRRSPVAQRPREEFSDARRWAPPTNSPYEARGDQPPASRQGFGRPLPARYYNNH